MRSYLRYISTDSSDYGKIPMFKWNLLPCYPTKNTGYVELPIFPSFNLIGQVAYH